MKAIRSPSNTSISKVISIATTMRCKNWSGAASMSSTRLGQEDNLRAAMAATTTIPIVMVAIGYDPLAKGYVSSLARPTGNVTGIYVLSVEAIKKAAPAIQGFLSRAARGVRVLGL